MFKILRTTAFVLPSYPYFQSVPQLESSLGTLKAIDVFPGVVEGGDLTNFKSGHHMEKKRQGAMKPWILASSSAKKRLQTAFQKNVGPTSKSLKLSLDVGSIWTQKSGCDMIQTPFRRRTP